MSDAPPIAQINQAADKLAPETPSQIVMKASTDTLTVTDERGRKIVVRSPTFLEQYRLTKMLGEVASNMAALAMASAAISIREFEGVAVPFPQTEMQIEALMARVGDEGFAAVFAALNDKQPQQEGIEPTKN